MSIGLRRNALLSASDGIDALAGGQPMARHGVGSANPPFWTPWLARAGFSLLLAVAAYATELVLYDTTDEVAYALIVPFVGVSAWYAGSRGGVVTAIAALLLLVTFPLIPAGSSVSDRRTFVPLFSSAVVSCATIAVIEGLGRAERRLFGLVRARDTLLDERTALLRAVLTTEERWHVLTDALPALVVHLAADGEVMYSNRRMIEYTGVSLDQLRERDWLSLVHPDDAEECRARWSAAMATGIGAEFQARIRSVDGSARRHLVIAEPVRDASGQIASWLNALVDIEDVKRVEDELSASERQYRLLSEAMPALVAMVDLAGNSRYRNQAFYDYTGLTESDSADGWTDGLVFDEDMPAIIEEWRQATETGKAATTELRLRRHDGAYRWHLVRAVPLGERNRWLLVATDIEDRKQAESQMIDALSARESAVAQHRYAEEQLTLLVEASSGLIESLELDDMLPRILKMSMRFVVADAYALWSLNDARDEWRILASEGLSEAYLASGSTIPITDVTPRLREALTIDDVDTAPMLEERRAGYQREGISSVFVLPLAVAGANTGTLTFYYRARHQVSSAELRVGTALANLTASALGLARLNRDERRVRDGLEEANLELASLAEDLREANTVKDEFLGMVSHELKTPITMILGGSEILNKYGDLIEPDDRSAALRDINESAQRLGQLIDNLLLLSRLEAGTSIELEPILVRHEIERIVADFRKRHTDRTFTVTIDPVISPVSADPTNFQQVLQNLLSNAIKYSAPQSGIDVVTERRGHELIVSVLDRGRGISEEESEQLFEPFYRSKRTSEGTAGAGVGLAVCRRLIEAQGGRIWAHPREGGGSVFSVALRVDPAVV